MATGEYKWSGAVALGGKIYGLPEEAERMLVYDPATRKVSGGATKAELFS